MKHRVTRAAAPTLPYLWITDDILAEAFNRFARVSRSCRRSVRHGSNIPGPLEAHRRSARRRMGLAASAAGNGPPTPDLGALFGLGIRTPPSLEQSLKWEPPSLHSGLRAGPPPPPPQQEGAIAWSWISSKKRRERHWEDEMAEETSRRMADPVEMSKDTFRDLLAKVEALDGVVTHSDLKPLLEFLHSAADEPDAHNLSTLAAWLRQRPLHSEALRALADTVRDKVILRTLDEEQLLPVLSFLLRRGGDGSTIEHLASLLDALPAASRRAVMINTTEHIVARLRQRSTKLRQSRLVYWMEVLRACQCMQGLHFAHEIWPAVYEHLAVLVDPSSLTAHFGSLDKVDFAHIMLRHWVPHFVQQDTEPTVLSHSGHRALRFRKADQAGLDMPRLITDFQIQCARSATSRRNGAVRRAARYPIVDLLVTLARHKLPYTVLLNETFSILKATTNPWVVYGVFRHMTTRSELGVPPQLGLDLIHYFLDLTDKDPSTLRWAWKVFRALPSISILHCLDLPLKLIEHGYIKPERIFYILNRKTHLDISLPEFRATAKLSLHPQHIEMAHLVAFAWSNQPRLRARVAFRRVWETYRFLQDRGAPLSILMSRALVKSGIVRPLQDGKYVPMVQQRYIVGIVRELEGEDVAGNLDRLVWDWLQRAKDPMLGEGRARRLWWAGRLDEGIVRKARWRMRLWRKGLERDGTWFHAQGVERKGKPPQIRGHGCAVGSTASGGVGTSFQPFNAVDVEQDREGSLVETEPAESVQMRAYRREIDAGFERE